MANIINRITRAKSTPPDWIRGMSDEQLNATIQQLEMDKRASGQGTLQDIGNIFLQRGGLQPVQKAQGSGLQPVQKAQGSDLNDFMAKEMFKAKMAEQNPMYQIKLAALKGGLNASNVIDTTAIVENGQTPVQSTTDMVNPAAIPTATAVKPEQPKADDSGLYWDKPIYKNIAGVPVVVGYEKKLTDEGKIKKQAELAGSKKQIQMRTEATNLSNEAKGMLDAAWVTADKLIPAANTPEEAEILGIKRKVGSASIFGMRPQRALGVSAENAVTYQQFLDGTVSMVIRSLGEKGVLNNQDIKRAYNLMPGFSETTLQRKTKKEELINFLDSRIQSYMQKKYPGEQLSTQTQTSAGDDPLGLR